jgi:hypothetical protein
MYNLVLYIKERTQTVEVWELGFVENVSNIKVKCKGKAVPVHAMNTEMGNRGMPPIIINRGNTR